MIALLPPEPCSRRPEREGEKCGCPPSWNAALPKRSFGFNTAQVGVQRREEKEQRKIKRFLPLSLNFGVSFTASQTRVRKVLLGLSEP